MYDLTSMLLREAWAALGGEDDLAGIVNVEGEGDGLLPSTLPALPAMLAAVGTSTLAASVLDGPGGQRHPPRS